MLLQVGAALRRRMVVPRRADFDFRATSASRVALDSIEQPTDAGQTPAPPRRASPLAPCPCPLPPAPVHRSSDPSARLTRILLHHKQTRPTSLHCPRRSGRTSLRFGQRPRSRQEFGASRRAMGRPATSSSMSRKVGCHQLAPCFGPRSCKGAVRPTIMSCWTRQEAPAHRCRVSSVLTERSGADKVPERWGGGILGGGEVT